MTIPDETGFTETGYPEPLDDMVPIPVKVIADTTKTVSLIAEYGSYQGPITVPLAAPIQLVNRSKRRQRAVITVGTITGGGQLILNSRLEALQQPTPLGVYLTQSGQSFEHKSQQPLYAVSLTAVVPISVLDEIYGSPAESTPA